MLLLSVMRAIALARVPLALYKCALNAAKKRAQTLDPTNNNKKKQLNVEARARSYD